MDPTSLIIIGGCTLAPLLPLAVLNSSAGDVAVQLYLSSRLIGSFGSIPRSGIAGSCADPQVNFLRKATPFPQQLSWGFGLPTGSAGESHSGPIFNFNFKIKEFKQLLEIEVTVVSQS